MMRRALLASLIALAWGCREADEPSQTIVFIDAESGAKDALQHVTVQAIGPNNNRLPVQEAHEPSWPIKLVLAPRDGDASRRFTVEIEGRDANETVLAKLRFKSGFVASETRAAKLMIHDACVKLAADSCSGDACNEWTFDIDADKLGRGELEPRLVDAKCDGSPTDPTGTTDVPTGSKTDPIKEMPTAGASVPVAGSGGTIGTSVGAAGAAGSNAPVGTGQQAPDCPIGHLRDATGCVDIDECQTDRPCGDHGQCTNIPSKYACTCDMGFEEKLGTCAAIDHCETNKGGCEGTCSDSPTGAVCACAPDETLKADRKACGKLGPAKRIDYLGSKEPTTPQFAFDGAGNGVAIWAYSDGTNSSLWTRRYVAGSGWVALPSKLAIMEEAGQPGWPRIALDSKGTGVVVFTQTLDSHTDVWAVRYNGTSFGTPQKINNADVGSGYQPSVALDVQGNGFAAWTAFDGSTAKVWVNRFRADTGWSSALPAQTASGANAVAPRISLDALGNATVAWTQFKVPAASDGGMPMEFPEATVWAVRWDAKLGRWRLPASQLDGSGSAGLPDSQMFGTDGASIAIWTRVLGTRVTIRASRFDAGSWSTSTNIATGDFTIPSILSTLTLSARVALSSSGRGAAIWVQPQSDSGEIWGNQFDATSGAWIGAKLVRQYSATEAVIPQIAVDSAGDGFAVWQEIQGTARTIQASRLQADGGFVAPVELSSDTTAEDPDNSDPQVTVDQLGNAVVVWDVYSAGQYETWASVFE